MDNGLSNLMPVRRKDRISFRCQNCGMCCRHVHHCVMLGSLDAYRIAKHLGIHDEYDGIFSVFEQYAEVALLIENYPFYTLKTVGEDEACIFLKEDRCSIYPARPRSCRIYPFTVEPKPQDQSFAYYLCLDREHHLDGGKVHVKEWMRNNFSIEDQEFVLREFKYASEICSAIQHIPSQIKKRIMNNILYYVYWNYDLMQEFLPQYEKNCETLLREIYREIDNK